MNRNRISESEWAAVTVHEAAAYWFVRQDAGEMMAQDQTEFATWLAASDTHRTAYEKTSSTWKDFQDAAEEGELRALRVAALAVGPVPRVWPKAWAIAAGIVAAVGLGTFGWNLSTQPRSLESIPSHVGAPEYLTVRNQRSTVTLPDGTVVSMNIDTAFDTDFSAGQRLLHLKQGQAFFDVAQDPHRPFIVAAGDRRIRALGTQFDVRLKDNAVEVVLVEGRVSVDRSQASLLDKVIHRPMQVELKPGQRLVAAIGKSPSVTATNAAQATSWREGWIVFEDETVEDAVAELNRYSDRPIVADHAVKRLRFSGVFRIGQPDRFGAIIQELLPISAERGASGETVLVPR